MRLIPRLALAALALASLLVAAPAAADTVGYPTTKNASFLIDYPGDWEMTPGEEMGDYVTLMGPAGATLMFRTIDGTEEAMQGAIEDSYAYIGETYGNLKLSEPESSEHRGLSGFYGTGTGTDEEGTPMRFGLAWYALNDGKIGEIWFVAAEDDKAGIAAAGKILESFRAP